MLRMSSSTDSSASTTQIAVKHDGFNGAEGKSIEKSSENRRIVKESKSFKGLKNLQRLLVWRNVYQSTDPPPIKIRRTRVSVRALAVFRALFAMPKSFLDTIFGAMIVKAKLVKLLILCYVFFPKEQGRNRRSSSQKHSSFSPAVTNGLSAPKFLSAQRMSSLWYFNFGIYPGHFAIKTTRELITHVLPLLNSEDAFWKKSSQPRISLMAMRMLRELCITKAYPTFLRSSKLS